MSPASRPKVVVLDGHALNPGDLDWAPLRAVGDCTIHDRTPRERVAERAAGAAIVLTNKALVQRDAIERLPALRYIGVLATGYNVVDVAAARERGIPVTNIPGYGTASVAQHVFALLLELTQRTGHHAASVRDGRWSACPDFCYWDFTLTELAGRTLGIVGYGEIGRAVARIGLAFGMKVIASTRTPRDETEGVDIVPLEDLLCRADVVTLHCPLSEETMGLINSARLGLMKPTAFLINTGRGPLVVEADLAAALDAGRIAGAGLDVLSSEPPPANNPLVSAKNCLITPHIAWATREARERLLGIAVANIHAFLAGHPRHVVN